MNRRRFKSPPKPPGLPDWLDKAWDADFDWHPVPTKAQVRKQQEGRRKWLLKLVTKLQKKWEAEEDQDRRRRAQAIAAAVARDKVLMQQEAELERLKQEREARLAEIKHWWEQEHEREAKAADEARRKKLSEILIRINKDTDRVEREELTRRGVVRGLRGAYRGE